MTQENKTPLSFWIISGIATVWNLIGVLSFVSSLSPTPETLSSFTEEQQSLLLNKPVWAIFGFGLAVFAGLGGSLALLFRKKMTTSMFIASLAGIAVQYTHAYMVEDGISIFGALVLPALVVIVGVFLLWYGQGQAQKGRLN
ncbi:MAG: hypothetical protein CL840_18330 [Crocinitomicaceae bacterium]|nr:hypothetical protein [Crocinitomicaceae bacterium]|tara:strand:- start:2228 stop:2653 length:426 start_codon:yes stop_codon:yes gene_type:complete